MKFLENPKFSPAVALVGLIFTAVTFYLTFFNSGSKENIESSTLMTDENMKESQNNASWTNPRILNTEKHD